MFIETGGHGTRGNEERDSIYEWSHKDWCLSAVKWFTLEVDWLLGFTVKIFFFKFEEHLWSFVIKLPQHQHHIVIEWNFVKSWTENNQKIKKIHPSLHVLQSLRSILHGPWGGELYDHCGHSVGQEIGLSTRKSPLLSRRQRRSGWNLAEVFVMWSWNKTAHTLFSFIKVIKFLVGRAIWAIPVHLEHDNISKRKFYWGEKIRKEVLSFI